MKILIIEDDISTRNVLRLGLESKGFTIDEAGDGNLGSYLARTNTYDLILLDNVLPHKMGGRICKEVREAGRTTPIIILSSKQEILTKVQLFTYGADDYVTKPFSFEELLARIHAIVRRPKMIQDPIFRINHLEINFQAQTVTYKNRAINLTKKEFGLLEFLFRNKNKVLSRTQILENVWDMEVDPFSNTVDTHVMNLRKKIKDSKRNIIQSVTGRGYKLNFNQK